MSLFRKYGESLLGQPIGIEESRVRQAKDRNVQNTGQEMRKNQRIGRRLYREALRSGNIATAAGIWKQMQETDGGFRAGIRQAGQEEQDIRGRIYSQRGGDPVASTQQFPEWDGDGNRIPDMVQRPMTQPQQAQPITPRRPSYNPILSARMGLFDELKKTLTYGGDLGAIQKKATSLGISTEGLNIGLMRAEDELGSANVAKTVSQDSPFLTSRLLAFNPGRRTLFA